MLALFLFLGTVSAATISSVSWNWNAGYLAAGDGANARINLGSCPGGTCWCTLQANGVFATPNGSDTGWIDFLYTAQSGHTNRALGAIPVVAECCDDQPMTSGCDEVISTSNSSPGVDTAAPTSLSITISDNSGYTNDSTPSLTISATDALSGMDDM